MVVTNMSLPILYSFRRCPYAMRARIGFALAGVDYIVREVDLKNKPKELYVHELAYFSRTAETAKKRNRYASELHDRITTPLLVIGFVALALSVLLSGDIDRRGTVKRILLAIVLVSVLQLFSLISKKLIKNDASVFWMMYLAAAAPIALAIVWPHWIKIYTLWLIRISAKGDQEPKGTR